MMSNQGKWPIVFAAGLLCLMTLLSVVSWSGKNPLKDKMASRDADAAQKQKADRAYRESVEARFIDPLVPVYPTKGRKPKLNRYRAPAQLAKQNTTPEKGRSGSPENAQVTDAKLAEQKSPQFPKAQSASFIKDVTSQSERAPQLVQSSNQKTPAVNVSNRSNKLNDLDKLDDGQKLSSVFGDKVQQDFSQVRTEPKNPTPAPGSLAQGSLAQGSLAQGAGQDSNEKTELPVDPTIDLKNQNIENQLLAQFNPERSNRAAEGDSKSNSETTEANDLLLPSKTPIEKSSSLPVASNNEAASETKTDPDQQILELIWDPEQNPSRQDGNAVVSQRNDSTNSPIQDAIVTLPANPIARKNEIEPKKPESVQSNAVAGDQTQLKDSVTHPQSIRSPSIAMRTEPTPAKSAIEPNTTKRMTWPATTRLLESLDTIEAHSLSADWVASTKQTIEQLQTTTNFSDPLVARSIRQLYQQIVKLDRMIVTLQKDSTSPRGTHWETTGSLQRVRYQLHRRLEIWTAVYRLAAKGESTNEKKAEGPFHSAGHQQAHLDFDAVPQAWRDYLELDQLKKTWERASSTPRARTHAARKVLARATANHLTDAQFEYIEEVIGPTLAQRLRDAATQPTDVEQLLAHLERFEQDSDGVAHYYLNDHYQNLYWSADANANYLAEIIDVHYRNANLRVSISETLANRWLPQPQTNSDSANERGLGSQLLSPEVASKRFFVDFMPNAKQWHIRMNATGEIESRPRIQRDGIGIAGIADADFSATKDFIFDLNGSRSSETKVVAKQKRTAIQYDRSQQINRRFGGNHSIQPSALGSQIVESKIRSATRERFDEQVLAAIHEVSSTLHRSWTLPLASMDLEPAPLEMRTTQDRMMLRYRIAGQDQMAANSARPMAVRNSVISGQIHESAVNNFIAKTGIGGKRFTLQQFADYLNKELGYRVIKLDVESEENDVEFTLSRIDPVRMDFDQHHLSVTISLKTLRIGSSVWKNLSVTCPFNLSAQGLKVRLEKRDPGIGLAGQRLRLRDQIAIRSVFHKLIEKDFSFSLAEIPVLEKFDLKGLWISQLVFADGWAGLSINDESTLPGKRTQPGRQRETHHLSRENGQTSVLRIR